MKDDKKCDEEKENEIHELAGLTIAFARSISCSRWVIIPDDGIIHSQMKVLSMNITSQEEDQMEIKRILRKGKIEGIILEKSQLTIMSILDLRKDSRHCILEKPYRNDVKVMAFYPGIIRVDNKGWRHQKGDDHIESAIAKIILKDERKINLNVKTKNINIDYKMIAFEI